MTMIGSGNTRDESGVVVCTESAYVLVPLQIVNYSSFPHASAACFVLL